jgi:aminoglycoside phosphotransferase (APT) family kinase protein
MGDETAAAVVGFDVPTVEAWLNAVREVRRPLTWDKLAGGHSNLTYLVRDASGRELVIRRPPQGQLPPKSHDMWREYRIIEALWPTEVPVPEPIAYCDDAAVAETHFYVMGRCRGEPMYSRPAVAAWLEVAARRRAGEAFIDALAALHAIDPAAVGLGDVGRPDHYLARQLHTWYGSWKAQVGKVTHDDRRVHTLHELLAAHIPEQGPARIVHGDYGPHNTLFRQTGEISAVLDWEIATLGDPLADFAYSINAWIGPGDDPVDVPDPPTALTGFPTRQQVADRYRHATEADLSRLAYYRVFNYWRRACILRGVYTRYTSGQKSSEGVDIPGLLVRMNRYLEAAEALAVQIASP